MTWLTLAARRAVARAPHRAVARAPVVQAIALALALVAIAGCSRDAGSDKPRASGPGGAAPAIPPSSRRDPPVLAEGQRWNLLLITLDTVRADVLTSFGSKRTVAPNLEQLVTEGVLCTKAETVTPLTLPAHCSILTGLYPGAHGVRHNARYALHPSHVTLATTLRDAGHDTGAFVASFPLAPEFGVNQGFSVYEASFGRGKGLESERPATAVNAVAIPWLRLQRDAPFFGWIHYFDAHDPYEPPEPHRSRFAGSPYLGEVAAVDAAIGEVLAALASTGQLERTLVVIVSDHGEGLGDHGEPFHGLLIHGATVHVPLLFWGGPLRREKRTVDFPVSVTDIMPTTLALLGVKPQRPMQGLDLSAHAAGKAPAPARTGAISESWYGYLEFGWSPLRGIRGDRHRFIEAPTPELYDLREDPRELQNIALANLDTSSALRGDLFAQINATRDAGAAQSAAHAMTQADLEALQSLGYVASGGSTPSQLPEVAEGPDPKDMMGLFEQYNRARALLDGGDPAAALAHFETLIAKDPKNLQFRGKRAKAYAYLGRVAEAEADFRAMIAQDPANASAYWEASILFDLAGRQRDAIAILRDLQRVEPGYVGLIERIASMHALLGETDEALAMLEAVPEKGQEQQAGSRLALAGRIALRAGDPRRAVSAFDRALAAPLPGEVEPWLASAARSAAGGKPGEALLAIKARAEAHRDDLAAWSALCDEAVRQRSANLAASACATLTALPGHEPRDQALLVKALLMASRDGEAAERTGQLLAGNPGWWWMHRAWAEHHEARGARAEAARAFQAWASLDPQSKAARAGLARTGASAGSSGRSGG